MLVSPLACPRNRERYNLSSPPEQKIGEHSNAGPAVRGFVWTPQLRVLKDETTLGAARRPLEGQKRAVEDFRDWCKVRGIQHQFVVWSS
jgi:hypothetical protein